MIDRYVSPAELRRLISALLVVATLIVIAAFFAFMIVPGTRAVNRPHAGPALAPPQGITGWLDPAEVPPLKGYTVPPIDPATVMTSSPALVAQGKAVYDKQCASCHGAGGKGDGPSGLTLNPRPRDLTLSANWKNGTSIPGLYKTLDEGLKGTGMASYSFLPKKDRMAVAHYVQSLATFSKPVDDPKAMEALAKLFASAGEVVPNRIPVSRAMTLLVRETATVAPLRPEAGSVAHQAITDGTLAARTLARTPGWRASEAALAKALLPNLGNNGFSPSLATYSPAQWKALKADLERTSN